MEELKKNNLELQRILASLRVSRTEAVTLRKPLHLTFENVVSEMVIVLMPQDLKLLDLEIVP